MTTPPLFLAWSNNCNGTECVVIDDGVLAAPYDGARIVVASGSEERIVQLLDAGAMQVLVGEAALRDGSLISRLRERYDGARVGVYLPVARAVVNWSLDSQSNADFTCMVTSVPVPRWDALLADGESSGTDAIWWAEQMVDAGASMVVFATQLDCDDLLLAAECVERLGERVWFATREASPEVESWVRLAGATRFVVPSPEVARSALSGVAA